MLECCSVLCVGTCGEDLKLDSCNLAELIDNACDS